MKNYFKGQIKDLNNRDDYEIYNIDPAQWTDEDVEKYANDAADAVLFRLGYYAVNKSADFPAKVKQQFNNYCNHMVSPQEGMCALLQAFYLSHAFEYEVDEDIKAVCNQMLLKTGVYSMFTINVLGASAYTTDTEKQEAANSMCNAIDKLSNMLENGITGHGNYCYVTNTLVDYGEADYTGSVDVNYRTRGQIGEYISYGNGRINSNYKYDDKKNNNTPVFLGDTNTMVIAYHLASNGESFDQNYMAKNLAKQPVAQKSSVITSLRGEQNLPLDGSCRMKSHRILGSWFSGDPTVTLNSLPSSCTSEYIAYKRGINGSLYTGGLSIPSANKMLIGTSVYGESHWYWEKDELALMGGPVNDPSYTENMPPRVRTDISFWGDDYYRQSFSNSVSYNCLLQVPLTKLSAGDGPYPLVDLIVDNYDIKSKTELKELINKALDTLDNGNWTEESKARVFEAIINSGEFLGADNNDMEEVDVAMRRISTALDGLERVKQQQNVTLRFEPQLIDESDIIANDQILNGIIAEDIKGEVNYQLVGVNDNNLQGYFEVDKDNGSITVKKGLPVGEYKLMIKASSSGNDEFEPIEVNLIAGIMVK